MTDSAAGSVVVLLLWVYYASQIVLLGAEFTRVYTRREGSKPQPESFGAVAANWFQRHVVSASIGGASLLALQ